MPPKHQKDQGIAWLKGLQIVNGGQTTASLYFTKKKYPDTDLSRVRVPAKISVLSEKLGARIDLGPVHTIFARCVAIKKDQAQGAKRSWGATPARLGNAANGPF